jgi:hypothetical protein
MEDGRMKPSRSSTPLTLGMSAAMGAGPTATLALFIVAMAAVLVLIPLLGF